MDTPPSNTKVDAADRDTLTTLMRDVQQRLERLDARMDQLESAVLQGRDMGGIAIDTFDSHIDSLRARGVEVDVRSKELLEITELLTKPEVLCRIRRLAGQTDQLVTLLQGVEELPGLAATGIDAFDSIMANAQRRGIDLDSRGQALITALEHLSSPAAVATLEALFGPGREPGSAKAAPLENPILQLLVDATEAIREAAIQPPSRIGLFGLLRAGKDDDVQTMTSFAVTFARAFGRKLKNAPKLLSAPTDTP